MWVAVVLIVLLVVGFGMSLFWKRKEAMTVSSDDPNKTMNVMFFFADWCPHCQKAKPEWQSFKTEKEGTVVNGYRVHMTEIDCSNGKNPEIKEYQIKGYPTILIKKEGKINIFENTPTKDSLSQFLDSII